MWKVTITCTSNQVCCFLNRSTSGKGYLTGKQQNTAIKKAQVQKRTISHPRVFYGGLQQTINPAEFSWEKGKIQPRPPTLCQAFYCLPVCALKALLKRSKSINAFLSLHSSTGWFLGTAAANLIESVKESLSMLSCILYTGARAKNFPSKTVGVEQWG